MTFCYHVSYVSCNMLLILYVTKKGGIVSLPSQEENKQAQNCKFDAMDKTPIHLQIQNGYGSNINFPLTWQDDWTNGDNLSYHLFNSTFHSFVRRSTRNMVSTSGSTLWFHHGFGHLRANLGGTLVVRWNGQLCSVARKYARNTLLHCS